MESPQTKKISEKTQNSHELSPSCQNQKFLEIQNYDFLLCKSPDGYRKSYKLLSETFLIDFDNFQDKNNAIYPESQSQSYEILLESQTIEQVLRFNEKQDFMKSYNGFTRRINKVLFILVFWTKNNLNNNSPTDRQLRFVFLNDQGRIIHVMSNLAVGAIKKLHTIIDKFFRKLQNIYVMDISENLQDSSMICREIYGKKITKGLIYISPFSQQLMELTDWPNSFDSSKIFLSKTGNLQNSNSNLNGLIFCSQEHTIIQIEENINKIWRYQKIHDFIIQKAFRPLLLTKISQKVLFTNQWLNNTFAWYFNIIQSFGDKLSLDENINQSLRLISNKIATYFQRKSLQKVYQDQNYNLNNHKCFPDLLEMTKLCVVCKERKPKYGCLKCSKKYDMGINLCIEQCFKTFHKDQIKYLPKYAQSNQSPKTDEKSVSILDLRLLRYQKKGKSKKNKQMGSDLCVEENCKQYHPFSRYKMIRKEVKSIQKENQHQIKLMKMRGFELIDFSRMEWIDEDRQEIMGKIIEEQQKKIWSSQNSSKIEQESYQIDS